MPTPTLDLAYVNAAPVAVPQRPKLRVALIGCGGTGSWLAPSIARLARVVSERGQSVEVVFVDPDMVEAANVPRQNFCDAEIGRFKAETLATRFSAAWGVPIRAIPARFDTAAIFAPNEWDTLTILVGCVDNPAARQSIARALTGNATRPGTIWWLDCGNGRDNGQVLLGNAAHHRDLRDAFQIETLCATLPSPALVHPELLAATHPERWSKDAAPPPPGGTCAQIVRLHAQSLMVNQRVASEAADYLARLLLARGSRDGGLCRFATYFDLASGSTRSLYTTPAAVAAALHTTPAKLFGRRKQEKSK